MPGKRREEIVTSGDFSGKARGVVGKKGKKGRVNRVLEG
jgi:hypothetical protein